MRKRDFIFNTGKKLQNDCPLEHTTSTFLLSSGTHTHTHTQPCHHKGRLNTHLHTRWHRDMTDADPSNGPDWHQPEQMQPRPVCDMETRQHRYKKTIAFVLFSPTFWNIFNVILDFKRKPKKTFPCGNRNKSSHASLLPPPQYLWCKWCC